MLPCEAPLVALTVNVPVELDGETVAIAVLLLTAVKLPLKPLSLAVKFWGIPAPPLHAVPGGRGVAAGGVSTMALSGLGDGLGPGEVDGEALGLGEVDGEAAGLGEVDGDALGPGTGMTGLGLGGDGLCADCGVRVTPPPLQAAIVMARTAIAAKTADLADFKARMVFTF